MPAAAAAAPAELALAESFAVAAPEIFIPEAAMGAEFGTAAAFDALGAGAGAGLMGLEGLGMAGLEGISAAAPSLGEAVTQGIVSGGPGAGAAGINEAMIGSQQANAAQIANSGFSQAELQAIQRGQEMAQNAQNLGQVADASKYGYTPHSPVTTVDVQPGVKGFQGYENIDAFNQAKAVTPPPATSAPAPVDRFPTPTEPNINAGGPPQMIQQGEWPKALNAEYGGSEFGTLREDAALRAYQQENTGIMGAFNKAMNWAKENPWSAASMGLNAYNLLKKSPEQEKPEEYSGILSKYKMSPDFKGRYASPQDFQYTPRVYAGGGPVEAMSNANAVGANTGYPMADINKGAYATPYQQPVSRNVIAGASDTGVNPITGEMTNFASGGIASYKSGGEAAMDYYERMTQAPKRQATGATEPHAGHGDVGIYYDLDPDTRYLDPLTAAQVRMAKVNKRAGMQLPGMKRPTPMGQINLVPVTMKGNPTSADVTEAASGGIMSLGGYAAGGNPRLLKGPGDGMSDDIPATIANKQPARLADGEFVVPADVVSHLGNGSTDAGANKLHKMMTNVRKARTGNPKQGKQINPNKYIPT